MNLSAVAEFFGEPNQDGVVDPERYICFDHRGAKLCYELIFDMTEHSVAVSADTITPFCARSLFEIIVPCDHVQIGREPEIYGDRKQLVFGLCNQDSTFIRSLMIMMWDNGDLSIWPDTGDWLGARRQAQHRVFYNTKGSIPPSTSKK